RKNVISDLSLYCSIEQHVSSHLLYFVASDIHPYSLLDTHDLPRVIPYKELDQTSVENIVKKLMDEGLLVSPQESKNGSTIKTILENGLAEMENMLVIKTPANPLVTQFPTDPTSVDSPKNKNSESNNDSVDKTNHANRIVYSARSVVGTV